MQRGLTGARGAGQVGRVIGARTARLWIALAGAALADGCVSSTPDAVPEAAGGAASAGAANAGDPDAPPPARAEASIVVDRGVRGRSVGPWAFGLHTSVYDNQLHHPALPELLGAAGVRMLRYPGGGYADNYHWSQHQMTAWADGNAGYLGPRSDFGSYVSAVEAIGAALMITVNYGSNLAGTGPGEAKEAAAWVAYANGAPGDATLIGVDGAGNDWRTVGFWAEMRASAPLGAANDGYDFLRIAHPEPLAIEYWEIGNEVFGNGFYEGRAFELDLHVPSDSTERVGHPELSPSRYGRGVREYAQAMKAVDPSVKIGAVLNTPPNDYSWGPTWNEEVLRECGSDADFGIVHLYAGRDAAALLRIPSGRVPDMMAELRASFAAHAGANAPNLEIALTEIGPRPGFPEQDMVVSGLYAADAYVSLMEQGVTNIAWLELHNSTFLVEDTQAKGPAYHGIQMAHRLVAPGDVFLDVAVTTENTEALAAHAREREDGSVGVMLVNRSPVTVVAASVELPGASLSPAATRYDYALVDGVGEASAGLEVALAGNTIALELAPHSVTVLALAPSR
jgi:hypothetical protein